jgi:hypothetical protein
MEAIVGVSFKLPKSCYPVCPACERECIYFMFENIIHGRYDDRRWTRVCFSCSMEDDIEEILNEKANIPPVPNYVI